MFCRISAFCHLCHLRFSVLTPVHRVRDPLVFCDDSGEVRWFLNFFTGFCWFLSFFTLLGTLATAILGIYPGAPGKGSPCVLRRFWWGSVFFEFFYRILLIFVIFLHFWTLLRPRFSVFTPMHRVRDPLVFCDNFRQVLDVLDSFCRFCQFLSLFYTFRQFATCDFLYLPRCTG